MNTIKSTPVIIEQSRFVNAANSIIQFGNSQNAPQLETFDASAQLREVSRAILAGDIALNPRLDEATVREYEVAATTLNQTLADDIIQQFHAFPTP